MWWFSCFFFVFFLWDFIFKKTLFEKKNGHGVSWLYPDEQARIFPGIAYYTHLIKKLNVSKKIPFCPALKQRCGNYASPTSGEAYRDRQLTTNFEL